MYNPYSLSYHQPRDEMYNPYPNIIWQLATHATNQVKKELIFMPQTRDEMYNPYSPSCHQPGDEMYNQYSNIIWQLATHATNQVKKELIFMSLTR
ncbi:hypothetical protein ACFX2J_019636 [Malus domestica]